MNTSFTLAIAKSATAVTKLLGRGSGTALPGLIAERFDPQLAQKLARQLPHGVILVTGTNGKTTTTRLIAAALEASGERVLTNRAGSNLKRGIVSTLIAATDRRGQLDATIGLFEVDEASLRLVAPALQPKHILVLNLFRDQLDRYGEFDTIAALIGQGIAATEAKLYLNADDPLVASLAKYAVRPELVSYFGIEGLPSSAATSYEVATDSDRCPVCHERLTFSRTFYGHIGHYSCPNGDFSRPQPRVAVTGVEKSTLEGTDFTVALDSKRHQVSVALPGTYNLYNALATIAIGHGLDLKWSAVTTTLAKTTAAFGRVEKIELSGRTLYLLLVKNPAGFTQVIETFLLGQTGQHVMMIINDNHADGRDVSWLWDVPLEAMTPTKPHVLASGVRAADMALRLKYAGMTPQVEPDLEAALKMFVASVPEGETAYILPAYTAMLELRRLLARQTTLEEAGV